MAWDTAFEASPASGNSPKYGDDKIRETRTEIEQRMRNEHGTYVNTAVGANGTAAADWHHRAGSAVCYYQATAPTTRPNGEALSAYDAGRMWVNSVTKCLYVYTGSAWERVLVSGFHRLAITELTTQDNVYDDLIDYIDDGETIDIEGVMYTYVNGATYSYLYTDTFTTMSRSGTTLTVNSVRSYIRRTDSASTLTAIGTSVEAFTAANGTTTVFATVSDMVTRDGFIRVVTV